MSSVRLKTNCDQFWRWFSCGCIEIAILSEFTTHVKHFHIISSSIFAIFTYLHIISFETFECYMSFHIQKSFICLHFEKHCMIFPFWDTFFWKKIKWSTFIITFYSPWRYKFAEAFHLNINIAHSWFQWQWHIHTLSSNKS